MSLFRRAGGNIATFVDSLANPGATLGRVKLFSKLVTGVSQLFAQISDGTVYQLTPPVGLSFLPEQWAASNIAASDTNIAMFAQLSTNFDTFVMTRAGSLAALVWRLSGGPITAGTLTVTVRKNGATVALAGVSTAGGNPTGGRTTIATGTVTYVAGDLIDVQYTCDAGLLPTASMNLESTVEVTQ